VKRYGCLAAGIAPRVALGWMKATLSPNASRPSCGLGLFAVVTGVRGKSRGAVCTKRCDYFLFARFLAPFLALVDFLAFFLAIFKDSCHLVSNA
jgi:hypothetical protein